MGRNEAQRFMETAAPVSVLRTARDRIAMVPIPGPDGPGYFLPGRRP